MSQILIGREYPKYVIEKVRNAKHSIKVMAFAWYWYENDIGASIQKFNYELIRAKQRGVEVLGVVNYFNGRAPFLDQKIKIKCVKLKHIQHSKFIIIDNQIMVLGSHNLSKNAFELNHEVSAVIDDPVAIKRCNTFFDNLCRG